ncbi:MAG: hypothetical protein AAB726_01885 [Patescibacteria group bacterium]
MKPSNTLVVILLLFLVSSTIQAGILVYKSTQQDNRLIELAKENSELKEELRLSQAIVSSDGHLMIPYSDKYTPSKKVFRIWLGVRPSELEILTVFGVDPETEGGKDISRSFVEYLKIRQQEAELDEIEQ